VNAPRVTFEFDEHAGLYLPGDTISGVYFLNAADPTEVRACEVSILWYTLGKGEEDMAVHYFKRETFDEQTAPDLRAPRRFASELPNSPLSYDGRIVKIIWCVRGRVFLRRGREAVNEQPFQLGATPRPVVREQGLGVRD
jgi:hypothetical protein